MRILFWPSQIPDLPKFLFGLRHMRHICLSINHHTQAQDYIKLFSCSNQLSMNFVLLMNLKLLTVANSFLPNIAKHESFSANKYGNANYCWHFHIHHENTPMQIYRNFTFKNWKFSDKNSDIFHISSQNIDCGYSLEPPWQGGSNEYPQSMFSCRNKKKK